MRARAILGDIATVVHPAEGEFDLSGCDTAVDAIIGIITRHPMRQEELERALARWTPGQVRETLADLEASGQAQVVERYGARFWSAAPSRYPDEAHSLAAAPGRHRQREENTGVNHVNTKWEVVDIVSVQNAKRELFTAEAFPVRMRNAPNAA